MKHYPSLDYFGKHLGIPVIAFDKLDDLFNLYGEEALKEELRNG